MSMIEELRTLHRLFPNAIELAIAAEDLPRYEEEMAAILRFTPSPVTLDPLSPEEVFPSVRLQRTPFRFRGVPLTIVRSA